MKQTLRNLSYLYLALVIMAVLVDVYMDFTTTYGIREGVGCNLYDAMVIGVECRGFVGARALELFLNWPLLLLYSPIFAFVSLLSFVVAILLWTPVIYLALGSVRKRRAA